MPADTFSFPITLRLDMPEGPWVHGVVVALALTQFLIVWYLYRRSMLAGGRKERRPASGAGGRRGEPDDSVLCDECGARNEAGYRFCRNCTAELPGRPIATGADGDTRGRDLR